MLELKNKFLKEKMTKWRRTTSMSLKSTLIKTKRISSTSGMNRSSTKIQPNLSKMRSHLKGQKSGNNQLFKLQELRMSYILLSL